MKPRTFRYAACALALGALAGPAWAINLSVPGIHGDVSRSLLGDGTGVIVGIIDSGVDDTHPALAGLDSLGRQRMVAEANFVTTENWSTGDDVFGHGTWVGSVILSSDAVHTGLAPDARYVNARVLDSGVGFGSDAQVRNGIGFAIEQGAQILNLSLNYNATHSSGFSALDMMLDWAAYSLGVNSTTAVGNIPLLDPNDLANPLPGEPSTARSPGSLYNGISVGRTLRDYSKVSLFSATAYTQDGRMKPDIVAPGTLLTMANDDWESSGGLWDTGFNGTSFSAPHVAGLIAQQLEASATYGLNDDPLVVKATILNSASKSVLDRNFNPWEPAEMLDVGGVMTTSHPLDTDSGAGQIDGASLAVQYLAGEMTPGLVGAVGWDLNSVANGAFIDYALDSSLLAGSSLTATLTWYRHIGRTDNGNNKIDSLDSFFLSQSVSNLDLQILRDGVLMAESISSVDNVEHLQWNADVGAQYTLRVRGVNVFGGTEAFAVAWYGTAVPEPAGWLLGLAAFIAAGLGRRRGGRTVA